MALVDELIAAVKERDVAQVQALVSQHPALVNERTERGESPVLIAAYYHVGDVLAYLLNQRPNLNIFEAAVVGNTERVAALLQLDPKLVNAYAPDGFAPLGLAGFFGHPAVAELLVAHGADVNARSKNGLNNTALNTAAAGADFQRFDACLAVARILLAHGAEVDVRQSGGWTPLHEAAHSGHVALVRLLMQHGADPRAKNDDGLTPYALALKEGRQAVIDLLLEQGVAE